MLTPEEEAAIPGAEAQAELLDRLRDDFGLDGWWSDRTHSGIRHSISVCSRGRLRAAADAREGWLVKGVLHLLYSDAEAGKTWLALKLALEVIRPGQRVLWIDEELGPRDLDRAAAGARRNAGGDQGAKFVYLGVPGLDDAPDRRTARGITHLLRWRTTPASSGSS